MIFTIFVVSGLLYSGYAPGIGAVPAETREVFEQETTSTQGSTVASDLETALSKTTKEVSEEVNNGQESFAQGPIVESEIGASLANHRGEASGKVSLDQEFLNQGTKKSSDVGASLAKTRGEATGQVKISIPRISSEIKAKTRAATSGQTPSTSAATSGQIQIPSYGSIAAADLNKNLAMMNQNMYNGVTAVADPLLKFSVDTLPNLLHLYAIFNGVNVSPTLAALAKNVYGNLAVGGGNALGGSAVLGSSILGSAMKLGGHGVQASNKVLEAAAKAGINLAGKAGDKLADGMNLGATIAAGGLNTLGDGMLVGSAGVNTVTLGISNVLDAIGIRLAGAITSTEKTVSELLSSGAKVLENGVLKFNTKTQEIIYNTLTSYLQILNNLQNLINQYAMTIGSIASAAASVEAKANLGTKSGKGIEVGFNLGSPASKSTTNLSSST